MTDDWDDRIPFGGTGPAWAGRREGAVMYSWQMAAWRSAPSPEVPRPPGTCSMPVAVECWDDSHDRGDGMTAKVSRIAVFGHDGEIWGLFGGDPLRVVPQPKYRAAVRRNRCHSSSTDHVQLAKVDQSLEPPD